MSRTGPATLATGPVQARIGQTASYTAPEPLSRASIRYYALAIGADPGHFVDEAPPTLIFDSCQLTGLGEPDDAGYLGHAWDLPLPVPCALIRGGNDYRFHRPARPGDVIRTDWTLTAIEERTGRDGSPFLLVTADARYRRDDGALLATNTETNIHRPLPARATPAPPVLASPNHREGGQLTPERLRATGGGDEFSADGTGDLVRTITQREMVAYAGATWDWHRLHYDAGYARRIGMAGPVVDGQMLGALLTLHALQLGLGPALRLTRLWYRNQAPVLAGDTVRVRSTAGDPDRSGVVTVDQEITVDATVVVGPAGVEFAPPDQPGAH